VQIKDQKLEVLRMHLTYSLFRNQSKCVQIPHADLRNEWITNVTRSKRWGSWRYKQKYINECQEEQKRKDMRSLLADYSILLRQDKSPLEQRTSEIAKMQSKSDLDVVVGKTLKIAMTQLNSDLGTMGKGNEPDEPLKPVLENFLR